MLNMLLLKTDWTTFRNVIDHQKHASQVQPRLLCKGDILLIYQNLATLSRREQPIKYAMKFIRCYLDVKHESEKIWGRHFNYIMEGEIWHLYSSFDISNIQISNKNYRRGAQKFVYIDPADVRAIIDNGYLNGDGCPDILRPKPPFLAGK